ncbi:MAG: PEP-CTERM sorting domain-containing protein [Roseibacillus sp.]
MKKNNIKLLAIPSALTLAALSQTASAVVILGGSTGNADFQATTTYPNGGGNTAPFSNTAGWVNIGGSETGPSFGAANQLNASPDPAHDPKQGAFLSVGNEAANTTGYTIAAAGEVFDTSLFLGATGGSAGYGDADPNAPGNGNLDDEMVTIFLFTALAPVDDSTALANITRLASASFDLDRLVFGTQTVPNFYTSTAGDIGETVYFGIELINPTGGNPFPRIDVVTLDVTPVPEPASAALLGFGALGLFARRKRA